MECNLVLNGIPRFNQRLTLEGIYKYYFNYEKDKRNVRFLKACKQLVWSLIGCEIDTNKSKQNPLIVVKKYSEKFLKKFKADTQKN